MRAPGEGRAFPVGADRVVVKGATTHDGDGFSVIEYEGAPGVPGPPMHAHLSFEECWYILAGEVDFHLFGGAIERVGEGGFILVPRGVAHTFRVAGATPARWIGIFSPGSSLGMLEELGEILPADGPPDMGKIESLFARYQTELVADGAP